MLSSPIFWTIVVIVAILAFAFWPRRNKASVSRNQPPRTPDDASQPRPYGFRLSVPFPHSRDPYAPQEPSRSSRATYERWPNQPRVGHSPDQRRSGTAARAGTMGGAAAHRSGVRRDDPCEHHCHRHDDCEHDDGGVSSELVFELGRLQGGLEERAHHDDSASYRGDWPFGIPVDDRRSDEGWNARAIPTEADDDRDEPQVDPTVDDSGENQSFGEVTEDSGDDGESYGSDEDDSGNDDVVDEVEGDDEEEDDDHDDDDDHHDDDSDDDSDSDSDDSGSDDFGSDDSSSDD